MTDSVEQAVQASGDPRGAGRPDLTTLPQGRVIKLIRSGVDRDALVPYLRIFAFFVPLSSGVAVTFAGTRGFGTMIPYALSQNVGMPGLRFALLLSFVFLGLGSTWIALGWTIPILLAFTS